MGSAVCRSRRMNMTRQIALREKSPPTSAHGVPDPEWGELPKAVVVLKKGQQATPEEIMEFCRKQLASFKRPKSVIFVDSLPRNPMGKVLKRELRDKYGKP